MLKIYNRKQRDFNLQEEYDDYQEMIEDLIMVLADPDAGEQEKQKVRDQMRNEKVKNSL